VHKSIRDKLAALDSAIADGCRILYGGSMKPDNARELISQADIDGGLIGGAALKAEDFLGICTAAN
jgi:triosephosphate isomerase